MKRDRKTLKAWFKRRLQAERKKHIAIINNKQYELNIARESLEATRSQNITLEFEVKELKETIDNLKKKKWYQFSPVEN